MPLYRGGARIAKLYKGSTPIARAYRGAAQAFGTDAGCDCTPAYVTGDRTSSVIVTTTATLHASSGPIGNLVDGDLAANATGAAFFNDGQNSAGLEVRFQFAIKSKVTEARWIQNTSGSHGTWRWQGSDDGSAWENIGGTFTLGASGTQTHTELNGNTEGYFYYRLLGVSGTTSWNPWIQECEFKQCAC
jgi:hypothetical protein